MWDSKELLFYIYLLIFYERRVTYGEAERPGTGH